MIRSLSAPRLIFWEATAGCNLRCVHCRRIEVADRLVPEDLTAAESRALIDQVAAFDSPVFVLSGGEPLLRPDIFALARYASDRGLRTALATNATLIDRPTARRVLAAAVRRVAVSLDGATARTHDSFRGLPGSYAAALNGIDCLRAEGISVQINTTVARHNVEELPDIFALALSLGADALHVFLLVPVGCGVDIAAEQMISPQEYERVLEWVWERDQEGPLELKATCAPHYLRVARQREPAPEYERPQVADAGAAGHLGNFGSARKGCLAGSGVCFVSHRGDVFPCGYLPLRVGSVREQPLRDIWQRSPVFHTLRDPDAVGGKCGVCEFRRVCGGCRARALGMSGDFLAEEPFCVYEPLAMRRAVTEGA
ncbi:MAG: radical SAM protein [Dehalococcoidia bacterium]|nr:radical SAM protein [Dehalococcoidia bacterium]